MLSVATVLSMSCSAVPHDNRMRSDLKQVEKPAGGDFTPAQGFGGGAGEKQD